MNFDELAESSLTQACQSLLPPPSRVEHGDGTYRFAAVIGYSADKVRGTLGVSASSAGIERLCAHNGIEIDLISGDALGELANHILGRIKRSFDRYQLSISISTPLVLKAVSIEVCSMTDLRREFVSEDGNDRIQVWLDCQADADLTLTESPEGDAWVSSEAPILF